MKLFIWVILLLINFSASACESFSSAACCSSYPNWSALFYLGKMTNDDLGEVVACHFSFDRDTLYSLEIGKELNPNNPFRRFFQPVVSSVDVRGNVTLLDDTYGKIYELNPYFTLNWVLLPHCKLLKTTISFGEGMSYVSKVPYSEEKQSDTQKKLLNFLLFEIAVASPTHPQWELVARIHHRSGAYGFYHANNAGSTAIGLALRYRFSNCCF